MKLSEAVAKYIELRDEKAKITADAKAAVAEVDKKLDKIEAVLLSAFDKVGMESGKCATGTAYILTRTSATVADKDAFLQFIRDKDEWALADVRASKAAIEQFKAANDELPPGVNWREERTLGVRRA